MKRFFILDDEFFIIDFCEGDYEFSINYGDINSYGEYKVYGYDSSAECMKEALSMIDDKIKQGFIENKDFNFNNHIFIDDFDFGPHRKTSHPNFINHFTDDLYFRIYDKETPFGSDEGHDTLAFITDAIVENPNLVFSKFPKYLIQDIWNLKYIPANSLDVNNIKTLIKKDKNNLINSDLVTYATAFSQIKLTGCVDKDLKQRAINSMKRYNILIELSDYPRSETIDIMISDLKDFNESF